MDEDVFNRIADSLSALVELFSSMQPKSSELKYKEWAQKWLETYKAPNASPAYMVNLDVCLRKHILPVFGERYLHEIDGMSIQLFLQQVKGDNTRSKCAAVLSDSLRKAYNLQMMPFNPYLTVEYKRSSSKRELGALTHKEQAAVLEIIKDRKRLGRLYKRNMVALTYLLLCTGIRPGEACALTASSFDFGAKVMYVKYSYDKVSKQIKEPKTFAGRREIPIEEPLITLLRKECRGNSSRIFPYNSDYIGHYYKKVFNMLNIKYPAYILRHTCITNLYEFGLPAFYIKKWSGHSTIKMAETYLALRQSSDYVDTEITEYVKKLKNRVVPASIQAIGNTTRI